MVSELVNPTATMGDGKGEGTLTKRRIVSADFRQYLRSHGLGGRRPCYTLGIRRNYSMGQDFLTVSFP